MIVVMKRNATQEMIQRMAKRVESLGLKAHVIVGTERTVIAAIGEKRNGAVETLSSYEEVEKVMPILAPYKVASRETKPEPTVVRALDLAIGCGPFRRHRRPLLGRERKADHAGRRSPSRPQAPRDFAAELSSRGQALIRSKDSRKRGSNAGRRSRRRRGWRRDRDYDAAARRSGLPICRRAADRRPQHAELSPAASGGRDASKPVLLEARPGRHNRRVPAGRGIRPRPGKRACDPLRAGHPHVRGAHAVHAAAGHSSLSARDGRILPVVVDPSHGTGIASLSRRCAMPPWPSGCDGL